MGCDKSSRTVYVGYSCSAWRLSKDESKHTQASRLAAANLTEVHVTEVFISFINGGYIYHNASLFCLCVTTS